MRREKSRRLCRLYLGYTLDKATIILLAVAIILLVGALFLIANPFMAKDIYLASYKEIHTSYFNQGIFIIGIFNSLIIAMISLRLSREAISFDALFISYLSRYRICIAKILASFIFITLLTLVEVLILAAIPLILYSRYAISIAILYLYLYILAGALIELYASMFLSTLIRSIIVPLMLAFIAVVLRLLASSFSDFNEILRALLPIINIKDNNFICDSIYFTPLWIIGFMLLYIGAYEIRDLKENL